MARAGDQAHPIAVASFNHIAAIRQIEGHRFIDQHVFTVPGANDCLFGMPLMWATKVNNLYRLVRAKVLYGFIGGGRELLFESVARFYARIHSSDQQASWIIAEGLPHQHKPAPEPDSTPAERSCAGWIDLPPHNFLWDH